MDSLLCATAGEALSGHRYSGVKVKGKTQLGDSVAADWKGELVRGKPHAYDGVEVEGDTLVGNSYGGKGFWA